jgi:hypothetical protein
MIKCKKVFAMLVLASILPALVFGYAYDAVGLSALCATPVAIHINSPANDRCYIAVYGDLLQHTEVLALTLLILAAVPLTFLAIRWLQRKSASGAVDATLLAVAIILAQCLRRVSKFLRKPSA